jgi:hypothetical protein
MVRRVLASLMRRRKTREGPDGNLWNIMASYSFNPIKLMESNFFIKY